jgi:hypothetical protein
MTLLKSLAVYYVTDKEITYGHNYIPGYEDLFQSRRNKIKNMLEIGIGLGPHFDIMSCSYPNYTMGSGLKMWRDYFPGAQIYGMDILECPIEEHRITTLVANQSQSEDLLQVVHLMGGVVDIVIDDGSHVANDQVFSFMVLAEFIAKDGIYVIEDVQGIHIESFKSLTIFPTEFQAYIKDNFNVKWYDTRQDTNKPDDFLMVFIRK